MDLGVDHVNPLCDLCDYESSYWVVLLVHNVSLFCSAPIFRKSLTLKYYAKKILYFLRQQNILKSLKTFLEQPAEQQSALEGEA